MFDLWFVASLVVLLIVSVCLTRAEQKRADQYRKRLNESDIRACECYSMLNASQYDLRKAHAKLDRYRSLIDAANNLDSHTSGTATRFMDAPRG